MILKKGAEADLYLEDFKNVFGFDFYNEKVVIKKRVKKNYRINEIDDMIRGFRTVKEAKIINKTKLSGVYSPALYLVDLKEKSIELYRALRDSLENNDYGRCQDIYEGLIESHRARQSLEDIYPCFFKQFKGFFPNPVKLR